MNEVDKIIMFIMFMSKQFVSYFAKLIYEMIEVRHDKLFFKTQPSWQIRLSGLGVDAHRYNIIQLKWMLLYLVCYILISIK